MGTKDAKLGNKKKEPKLPLEIPPTIHEMTPYIRVKVTKKKKKREGAEDETMLRGSQAIASRDNNWRGKVVRLINDPFACAMGSVEPRPYQAQAAGWKTKRKKKKAKEKY
jgi:hypothetical protein